MPDEKHQVQDDTTSKQTPACGLCGNTKDLTKTECCGNWICDDEETYEPFSYARNSCYRNHCLQTVCGVHFYQEHKGRWQECQECRDRMGTEMFVWCATNEYNFEKLANPPAFEPTHCSACGKVIVLHEGGYSIQDRNYYCDSCSGVSINLFGDGTVDTNVQPPSESANGKDTKKPHLRLVRNEEESDELENLADRIPEECRDRFSDITRMTDAFCDTHLDHEYKELSRELIAELFLEDMSILKGKAEGWAAGAVYALGQVNFLNDSSFDPYMVSEEIAIEFNVSTSTMRDRAKKIHKILGLFPFHPDWTLPSLQDDNPLVWMHEVNGMIMDIREAPLEIQMAAFEQGLIPYVPSE